MAITAPLRPQNKDVSKCPWPPKPENYGTMNISHFTVCGCESVWSVGECVCSSIIISVWVTWCSCPYEHVCVCDYVFLCTVCLLGSVSECTCAWVSMWLCVYIIINTWLLGYWGDIATYVNMPYVLVYAIFVCDANTCDAFCVKLSVSCTSYQDWYGIMWYIKSKWTWCSAVYICVYVCIYADVCQCVYVFVWLCVFTWHYVYVCKHVCVFMCLIMCLCVWLWISLYLQLIVHANKDHYL